LKTPPPVNEFLDHIARKRAKHTKYIAFGHLSTGQGGGPGGVFKTDDVGQRKEGGCGVQKVRFWSDVFDG